MSFRVLSRAVLCQLLSVPVVVILLVGCGGSTTGSDTSGSPDSGAPDAAPTGCPAAADINSGAALGTACAVEGAYCPDPTCDPCVQKCSAVACTGGAWTQAVNTALCVDNQDASPPECPSISGLEFDQSCQSDSDCVAVGVGTLCAGGPQCLCAADAINVKDQSKYEQQLAAIQTKNPPTTGGGCMCPTFGAPRCIANHCVMCGGASPDCLDGG